MLSFLKILTAIGYLTSFILFITSMIWFLILFFQFIYDKITHTIRKTRAKMPFILLIISVGMLLGTAQLRTIFISQIIKENQTANCLNHTDEEYEQQIIGRWRESGTTEMDNKKYNVISDFRIDNELIATYVNVADVTDTKELAQATWKIENGKLYEIVTSSEFLPKNTVSVDAMICMNATEFKAVASNGEVYTATKIQD